MNAFQRAEDAWNEQAKPAEKHREPFSPEGTSTRPVSPQTPAAHEPFHPLFKDSALSSSHGLDGGSTAAEGAEAVVRGSATVDAPSVAELHKEIAKLRHDLVNAEAMRIGFNALVEKMEPLTQFVLAIHKLAHRPFLSGTELAIQTELKGLLDEVRR